jgi:ferredoxin
MCLALVVTVSARGDSFAGDADRTVCRSEKCCNFCPVASHQDAEEVDNPTDDQPTLDPHQFVGPVRRAYTIAQKKPELLAQLHCYCGCDRRHGHRSLLDCYRSRHSASCETCVGEAIEASKMQEHSSPIEQIRAALKSRFEHAE